MATKRYTVSYQIGNKSGVLPFASLLSAAKAFETLKSREGLHCCFVYYRVGDVSNCVAQHLPR